jgi:hypothetical protein
VAVEGEVDTTVMIMVPMEAVVVEVHPMGPVAAAPKGTEVGPVVKQTNMQLGAEAEWVLWVEMLRLTPEAMVVQECLLA